MIKSFCDKKSSVSLKSILTGFESVGFQPVLAIFCAIIVNHLRERGASVSNISCVTVSAYCRPSVFAGAGRSADISSLE